MFINVKSSCSDIGFTTTLQLHDFRFEPITLGLKAENELKATMSGESPKIVRTLLKRLFGLITNSNDTFMVSPCEMSYLTLIPFIYLNIIVPFESDSSGKNRYILSNKPSFLSTR